MPPRYRASIVSHTHWDREWYAPFQVYRMRMVGLIDELITKMETDPGYRFFHFDGQAILFKDYLEIRPEMEPRLRALCRAGRIISGPMYVAPDESLPGAETHVRNFLLGRKVAGDWGPILECGYVIDVFGHISQWPQILRQCGIDTAILQRGIIDETCGAEFLWRGADGSEVLTIRLSNTVSYSDFWYKVRQADEGKLLEMDAALLRLKDLIDWQLTRHSTPELLLMDGVDHIEIQPDVPDLIERYNALHGDEGEVVHESLPVYLERLKAAVDRGKLYVAEGELRTPNKRSPLGQVFFGFHCSHPELKAANDRCEALLQFWAEPLMAANFLLTGEYDAGHLWYAWEQLLQNQPHDSICGCSVDQVHKDMMFRYDQCRLLAERIIQVQMKRLAERQKATCDLPGAQAVHIFNGSGTPVSGVSLVTIPFPHPRPEWFRLIGPDGQEVQWQLVDEKRAVPEVELGWGMIPRFPAKDHLTIAAELQVPAYGSAVYFAVPSDRPRRTTGTLVRDLKVLDTGGLSVAVQEDGTLQANLDREGGEGSIGAFDFLRFEDRGDVGDGWTYRAPERDEVVYSDAARVSVVCDGPLYAALRLETVMSIPKSASPDRRSRSEERVEMKIVSTVSVLKGDPAVHVETVVDNPARDHKLRVLFATYCPGDEPTNGWFSDSPFDLTYRPVALPDTSDWDEPAQEIWWQQSICGIDEGEHGQAIIAPECKESACLGGREATLALSLFRAFGQTVGTAGEDGPQMLGKQTFRYQIVPLNLRPFCEHAAETGLLTRANRMRAGLRAVVLPPHEGELPGSVGMVALAPGWLPITSLKRREAGDELLVRFFNPSPKAVEATLTFPMGITQAWRTNLLEEIGEELEVRAQREVPLTVKAKEIVTVAFRHC